MRFGLRGVALAASCMGMLGSVGAAAAAASDQKTPSARRQGGPDADGPHGRPPSPERMFAEMDANRDGSVSKAEFMAHHARHRPPHGPGAPGGGRRDGPPPRD